MPRRLRFADADVEPISRVARAAFSQRRKRLTNGLRRIAERRWPELSGAESRDRLEALLREVGIDPGLRPERVEPEAWLALARRLEPVGPRRVPAASGSRARG